MSKKSIYNNMYNKKNYKQIHFMLKPDEKKLLDKVLEYYDISIRKYILKCVNKENIKERGE